MLRRLTIENYGLIAHAVVDFAEGATMFTGETGSGKTMLVGALDFVLGARASPDIVRGDARTSVSLEFSPDAKLRARLENAGFELDADEDAVIAREMSAAGKSAMRLNGRAVTAAVAREFSPSITDIVGQHEAQRLLQPSYHLEMLDRFGAPGTARARAQTAAAYETLIAVRHALQQLEGDERRSQERLAFARAALDDIESTAAQPGEDDRLTERRRYLDHAERIASALRTAHDTLAGDERSASGALGVASTALRGVGGIAATLDDIAEQTAVLQSETTDLSIRIARELDATEFDAAELDTINARLDALERLKRKYGGSLDAVAREAEEFRHTIELFENRDESRAQTRAEFEASRRALAAAAEQLTTYRRNAARELHDLVVRELRGLAMPAARFEIRIEPLADIGAAGGESVEFFFAANAGEPARGLSRVASGGELSRMLLALIVVLSGRTDPTPLVFDEIDAGVGGATAAAVGVRLGRLARAGQIACVTHLAQIATWADRHYVLEKSERRDATQIRVRELPRKSDRVGEIARMLSGESHDAAMRHAQTLLDDTARRRTSFDSKRDDGVTVSCGS